MGHKNIYAALNAVMKEVGYVQKQRTAGLNYSYAGEAALIAAVRPVLVDHGVVVLPSGVRELRMETYETKSGAVMNRTVGMFSFIFAHGESETQHIVEVLGEGADSGDKSANKAMTAAYKYALREALMIETGDDPDQSASEPQERAVVPQSRPQVVKTEPPAAEAKRPYDAPTLKKGIAKLVTAANKTGAATDKQKGAIRVKLNAFFPDREEPDEARHTLLNFLFGHPSTSVLNASQVDALFKWTESEHAISEARAAVRYVESGNAESDEKFNEAFPKASGF